MKIFSGWLIFAALAGCSQPPVRHYDPCRAMMDEVRNQKAIESKLIEVGKEIARDSVSGDSSSLRANRERRSGLTEQAKYSKAAVENLGADCAPPAQKPGVGE
jgi:hypothetical protein